jgi:proteic killer suppression protein
MIKSWKHKGLEQFYLTGSKAGIQPAHARRLTIILQLLDAAETAESLNLPGFYFHTLKDDLKGYYSLRVNGNWRVIFQFKDKNAYVVNYLDYH